MKILTFETTVEDVESPFRNSQWRGHCEGGSFQADEIAYLSALLTEARERAPDPFRMRTIDRLHDVLNGKGE